MSHSDQVVYLTRNPRKFDSKLRQMIEAAKIGRMPPDQWVSYIKGLGSKGVKKDDIADSGVMDWLGGATSDSPPAGKPLEKQELLDALERHSVTIKEVVLGRPQYPGWHHGGPATPYQEILFIANSERANLEDRLEEIEFEMESLGFDLERLAEDPTVVLRLEKERAELMRRSPQAVEFKWSHFRSNDIEGKHGKNLLAHARITIHDGLYFIEEVQSDWGQSGRVRKEINKERRKRGLPEISWHEHVPKGPFVTDTRLWAGLVMRRLLQRAAMMPQINRVAWIRIGMKNGGKVNPAEWQATRDAELETQFQRELAQAQAEGRELPERPVDDADHFYTRLIPGIAEGAMGKAGGKVAMTSEIICGHRYDELPGFVMTPEAREALKGVQPLYSAASTLRMAKPILDSRLVELVKGAREMIGSTAHIRFVEKLYNLSDMRPMSGSYINRFINVALNAADVELALDHECYHFAHDKLLSHKQRQVVLDDFAPGTELNARVRDLLLRNNQVLSAAQCDNAEEAAAHGFAYWGRGRLQMEDGPVQGIFDLIARAIRDGLRWIGRMVDQDDLQTAEEVFQVIRSGGFAREKAEREAVPSRLVSTQEGEELNVIRPRSRVA